MDISDNNENKSSYSIKIISTEVGEISIGTEDIIVFEMIEDIFSVCMVGKLIFFDRAGATEMIPLTGNEMVSIIYGDNEITKTFIIYDFNKLDQGTQTSGTSLTTIEMYLVEPQHLALTQHRYSRSWKDKKISEIVYDVATRMGGITEFKNFEISNESLEYFYMPFWSPLEAIKWLSPRASGNTSKMPGYLFYSNSKGYNFHTLETLFTSKEFEKEDNKSITKYVFTDTENLERESKILSWTIEPINYQALNYLSGGHRLGYDFTTKSLIDYSYTYDEIISKYTMMGKKTLFTNISKADNQITLDGDDSEATLKNIAYHEFIRRYSKQFSVNIMVRGHDRRYAGMLIDIPWKSAVKTEVLHKLYEGKFMVKSITHQFSGKMQPYYRQLMVCVKTGYSDADYKTLVKSSKYNIKIPEKKSV